MPSEDDAQGGDRGGNEDRPEEVGPSSSTERPSSPPTLPRASSPPGLPGRRSPARAATDSSPAASSRVVSFSHDVKDAPPLESRGTAPGLGARSPSLAAAAKKAGYGSTDRSGESQSAGATVSGQVDPPPALSKLKTLAKSRWMQAARSVKLSMRANRVLREGNVTSHAAAAFMVHEAWGWEKGGVELDGRLLSGTPSARRLYRMFHNFTWLRRIPITVLLILSLVELPGWCHDVHCEEHPNAPTGWFWFLNRNLFHLIELGCALCILVETVWMLKMQGGTNSWGDFRRMDRIFQMKFAASGALIVDNIVSWVAFTWLRMGGYLRIAIFILTIPQVRKSFYNVISIVPKFLSVAFLFVSYIAFGGWLALAALKGTGEEETYSDLWTSIRLMTVLLTTANNPDVWLGAYAQNRLWGLFFLAYVCFGNFYLMSLLLATIYGVYKDQAGQTVMECERERTACLQEAFNLLDPDRKGYVDAENAKAFVHALNNHTDIPTVAPEHLPALIAIFDSGDENEPISLAPAEFEVLVEQLHAKFAEVPNPALQRSGWGPVLGPLLFTRVRALSFVRTKAFGRFITAMLLLNAVMVLVEWNKVGLGLRSESEDVLYTAEGVFGILYLVEMLLKWGGHSFIKYWRDPLNCYDGIITILSTGVEVALMVPNGFDQAIWLRWLIVMRVLRLTRLLIKVRLYKVIISTFFELLPSLFPLLCAFGCIVSVFATYGVQQFGGLSYPTNPRLEGTTYLASGYTELNFNDFPSALVLLICQCIVNNWFIVMDAYTAVTGTPWTRLYFFAFYFIATVFVLNLVIVVILDAAMAIIEADTPVIPDMQHMGDVDDDDDARFELEDEAERRAGEMDNDEKMSLMYDAARVTGDGFVAPENTKKGRAQRAILDFKAKLDALRSAGELDVSDDEVEDDEETFAGLRATMGLGEEAPGPESPTSPGASGVADMSMFDPSRRRLRGGSARVGSVRAGMGMVENRSSRKSRRQNLVLED